MSVVKCPSCGTNIHVPEKKSSGVGWIIGCAVAAAAVPIIVAVIGILAAIAVPSFMKARNSARENACINNLRMISDAKAMHHLEYGTNESAVLTLTDIAQYIDNPNNVFCPAASESNRAFRNNYSINPIHAPPTCKIVPDEHTLQALL